MGDIKDDDLKTITLKQVITNHPCNDMALQVRDHLMIFVEAQSTCSFNILIRNALTSSDRFSALPKLIKERGARTFSGIGMLVQQGALNFTLWTGEDAPVDVMYKALEEELAQ